MAETLVHTVPLPHFDLEKIVDQICGCEGIERCPDCVNKHIQSSHINSQQKDMTPKETLTCSQVKIKIRNISIFYKQQEPGLLQLACNTLASTLS